MAHTETTLTSKEIFNGHVIRVTYDTVKLEKRRHELPRGGPPPRRRLRAGRDAG